MRGQASSDKRKNVRCSQILEPDFAIVRRAPFCEIIKRSRKPDLKSACANLEEQFFEQFASLEEVAKELGVFGHAAHVNLKEGKAFCFMSGPDEESIRKAHAAINLPYDSITEVRRVTGVDIIPQPVKAQMRKAG